MARTEAGRREPLTLMVSRDCAASCASAVPPSAIPAQAVNADCSATESARRGNGLFILKPPLIGCGLLVVFPEAHALAGGQLGEDVAEIQLLRARGPQHRVADGDHVFEARAEEIALHDAPAQHVVSSGLSRSQQH